jgi:hypothetical protein
MLPYVLPERAKVPPEDGKSGLGNLGEHLLTTHSAEVWVAVIPCISAAGIVFAIRKSRYPSNDSENLLQHG